MKPHSSETPQLVNVSGPSAGFTLTELLVAAAITGVVISVAGFGLVSIMNANKRAEAENLRRMELNRATDYIADEIRMARRVNTTTSTTTTADAARTASNSATAFSPSLGNVGTIVLYLEIPLPSTTCDGSPGPTFDRVIYDIRANTSTWIGPRVINRYGRIPGNDGAIDPCSNPVASEALVDSISNTGTAPPCTSPAVRSGAEGFYACVNGRQVDLYLNGKLSGSSAPFEVETKVFSRSAPAP